MLKLTMEAMFRPEEFRTPADVAGQSFCAGVNAQRRAAALGRNVTPHFVLMELPRRGQWYVAFARDEGPEPRFIPRDEEDRAWEDLQRQCVECLVQRAKLHAIINRA